MPVENALLPQASNKPANRMLAQIAGVVSSPPVIVASVEPVGSEGVKSPRDETQCVDEEPVIAQPREFGPILARSFFQPKTGVGTLDGFNPLQHSNSEVLVGTNGKSVPTTAQLATEPVNVMEKDATNPETVGPVALIDSCRGDEDDDAMRFDAFFSEIGGGELELLP
jgi:hypothetical protein